MRIDPHVHCKTWRFPSYRKKSLMQIIVEEAYDAEVCRIFDMPNIENPVTGSPVKRKVDVEDRLKFARNQGVLQSYRTYVAATPDCDQLEEVAYLVLGREYPGKSVPGIKAFMGTSVGTLGITDDNKQKIVYSTLSDCGYDRVLVLHCEDDSKFNPSSWNPRRPETHCLARPLEAELSSIKKQIEFAREADFEGTLYGCHITSGQSIELFKKARDDYGLKVAVEITPHHAMLSMDDMAALGTLGGKMNPPLRSREEQTGLYDYLKHEKKIPIVIGSDCARHPFFQKIREPYMSGMGIYELYGMLIGELKTDPAVSNKRIEDLTYNNVVDVFGRDKCI